MSMSSIGAGAAHSQLSQIFQQRRKDFQAMSGAVQSGDMSAAQTALAALQQDNANLQAAGPSGCHCGWDSFGAKGGTNNPLSTDMMTLLQDVQSGDVTAAQKDLKQLQSDREQMKREQAATDANGLTVAEQDTVALIKAIQDGNADEAKQDLAKLQADFGAQGPSGHHRHRQQVDADGDGDGSSSATDAASVDQTVPTAGNPAFMSRMLEALTAYLGQNTPQASAGVSA